MVFLDPFLLHVKSKHNFFLVKFGNGNNWTLLLSIIINPIYYPCLLSRVCKERYKHKVRSHNVK